LSGTITFPSFFSPASQIPPALSYIRKNRKKKKKGYRSQHESSRAKRNRGCTPSTTGRKGGIILHLAHTIAAAAADDSCCSCGWGSEAGWSREEGETEKEAVAG